MADGEAVHELMGVCPNWKKTGGKVKSSHTRPGKNRAAAALRLAAWSLMRSQSYLGAYLRHQRSRLGAPKAITATAHKLAQIIYHLMRHGEASMKKEEAAYAEQVRQRMEKQFFRRAAELGFAVTRIEPLAAADEMEEMEMVVTPEEEAAVLAALEAEALEVWEAEPLDE